MHSFSEGAITRRQTLGLGLLATLPATAVIASADADKALLDDLERRTWRFFWETTDPKTGLAPDRWPTPSFSSIAAIGFALTSYPLGVQRGWITREQARSRVLTTLRFLHELPQGATARGVAGHKGFFYHFLDMKTGLRHAECELSTIDTALLLAGVLYCRDWFNEAHADAIELRRLANALYARVDWAWAAPRGPAICLGWKPEQGFLPYDWKGYNESMLLYLLALGAPEKPLGPEAWAAWCSTYEKQSWRTVYGQQHLHFAPLFGHQFTHCWVDFRGLKDAYMRGKGIDYFENSRRATLAQQAYAIANPQGWAGYGENCWGVTASDGPVDIEREFGGKKRRFISYAGRGMAEHDDGTLAPYGAGSSIVFAPEIVIPALRHMREQYGKHIYTDYGFLDSFNLSFRFEDVKLQHGRVVPGWGWVNGDYLGIDQGPMLAMLGNYRGETVWSTTRKSDWLIKGLKRAGFQGGWL